MLDSRSLSLSRCPEPAEGKGVGVKHGGQSQQNLRSLRQAQGIASTGSGNGDFATAAT